MVDVTARPSATGIGAAPALPRQLHRRRSLPGSRAVVGGFLVAAAALGTFGVLVASDDGPRTSYVALTGDVDAGERIGADDLALVPVDLPAAQRPTVLTDLAVAAGAVAVGPLAAGQLLAASDVVKLDGVDGRAQLSIPVEPARANNGELRRGELVDVIATTTAAGSAATETVASDAVVVRVHAGDRSLGSSNAVAITLSVPAADLEALADAAASATISIARVSGVERERSESIVLDGVSGDGGATAPAGGGDGGGEELSPGDGAPPAAGTG